MAKKQKIIPKSPAKTPVKSKAPQSRGIFNDKKNWFFYYNPIGYFFRNPFAFWLFVFSFVVFGINGINHGFALDDEFYTNIKDGGNKLTHEGTKAIPKIFKTRTFYNADGSGYSYRPVTLTAFAIEIQLFGEQPHVSHFINVLLYALTMILLFNLLRKWFVTQGNWFSFFVTLLFLVHPLHTEVVDNIKCRDELLAMLFTLCSIHVLWEYRETKKIYLFFLYPIFFALGLLSKTTVVQFYALIPLSLWFFTNDNWKKIILYMIPMIAAGVILKFWIKFGLPPESRTLKDFENPLAEHLGFIKLTATSFSIIGRYLFLLIIPYPLVYYYGAKYVDVVTWSNPIAIVSLIIYGALGFWALRELRKKSVLGFGLCFFLINMGVFSNLFMRAPGLMAERFMYAASLGFCIIVVALIFHFYKKNPAAFKWKSSEFFKQRNILLAIVLIFAVRSFARNYDWENKETLYGHDMQYLDESAKANMLYAALLSSEAMRDNFQSRDSRTNQIVDQAKADSCVYLFKQARIYYRQATEIAPYYNTAWSNLGTTYFFTGDPQTALPYFYKAVVIKHNYAEGWFNMGMAYDKLAGMSLHQNDSVNFRMQKDSAIVAFSLSIKSDSMYVSAYEQLSRIRMQEQKNPAAALALVRTAARKKPDSETPWNDMENIYLMMKDTASAVSAMEMAAKINPSNTQRLYNLATYFRIHGDYDKAQMYNSLLQEEREKQQKLQQAQREQREQQ